MRADDETPILIPDDATGSGELGRWTVDRAGLPAYDYVCNPETAPWAAAFRTDGARADHWHLVGNDRIVATAHAEGHVLAYLADRGKLWLNALSPAHQSWGGGFGWLREGARTVVSLRSSDVPRGAALRRRFGVGYFEKSIETEEVEIRHTVRAPFGDDPVLRIEVEVTNRSGRVRDLEWVEYWGVRLEPIRLTLLATGWTSPPAPRSRGDRAFWRIANFVSAASRRLALMRRRIDARLFRYRAGSLHLPPTAIAVPDRLGPKPPPTARAAIDCYPRPLFLASLVGDARVECREARTWFGAGGVREPDGLARSGAGALETPAAGRGLADPCLIGRASARVPPGGRLRAVFLYGMADRAEIPALAERHREDASPAAWRAALAYAEVPGRPWLTRETAWHGAMLRSHLTWEDYFESHICDQGSAYCYLQGMNSVPRDMAFAAAPLTYLAPARAREILLYILRMVAPDGTMNYATHGRGLATFAGMHTHPSDLWPMVFWVLSEYIGATRDFALLDEGVPFYPVEAGSGTVLDRLRIGLRFLDERIGRGPNGLLRIGSGDWSDGIQLMVRSRRRFLREGESTYTTALGEIACRRLASVVRGADPRFAADLGRLADRLGSAWRAQWNGRWYTRAWDGGGNPVGDDRLFLEHHVWCLVAGVPAERARPLLAAIGERLQAGSPIGARVVAPPTHTRLGILTPGWDVNGGIWAAMNGVLTWGLGRVDPGRAWEELEANSMRRHAEAYPRIWYGIWSGPDAYNAAGSEREGETFVHFATPMTDFPVMNMNRHASTLLATLRLLGIDADGDGITLRPSLPEADAPAAIALPLVGYRRERGEVRGYYRFERDGRQRIRIALAGSPAAAEALVDGAPAEVAVAEGEATIDLDGQAGETRRFVVRGK